MCQTQYVGLLVVVSVLCVGVCSAHAPIVDGVCKHRSVVEEVSLDRYLLTANKGVSVGSKKKYAFGRYVENPWAYKASLI